MTVAFIVYKIVPSVLGLNFCNSTQLTDKEDSFNQDEDIHEI